MPPVPPFALVRKWLDQWSEPTQDLVRPPYDDVLDVLREFIRASVPVDEPWYVRQYPAVSGDAVNASGFGDGPGAQHFYKHGYFEGYQPFAAGLHHLPTPTPFAELVTHFRIRVGRGRLFAEISRPDFLLLVRKILMAVPVDAEWYQNAYQLPFGDSADGLLRTASMHYVSIGYFEGLLPADVRVDAEWYVGRYEHVRNGLAQGVANSAKDHFMRIGYGEGCRPTPP